MVQVWSALAGFANRIALFLGGDPKSDQHTLDSVGNLSPVEWDSLQFLGKSSRGYEPLSADLNFLVATSLLTDGLVERGRIETSDEAYPMGYRITDLGKAVLKRGRHSNVGA